MHSDIHMHTNSFELISYICYVIEQNFVFSLFQLKINGWGRASLMAMETTFTAHPVYPIFLVSVEHD